MIRHIFNLPRCRTYWPDVATAPLPKSADSVNSGRLSRVRYRVGKCHFRPTENYYQGETTYMLPSAFQTNIVLKSGGKLVDLRCVICQDETTFNQQSWHVLNVRHVALICANNLSS